MPAPRRVANRYPPPPPLSRQVEMKYDVKSARGKRGGRVTAVASIWAEASKNAGGVKPTQPKTAAVASTPKPEGARFFASRQRLPTNEDSPPRVPRGPIGLGVAAAHHLRRHSPRPLPGLSSPQPRPSPIRLALALVPVRRRLRPRLLRHRVLVAHRLPSLSASLRGVGGRRS